MKKCSNCGTQIDDNSLFCTECGKQIPQGNVCSHCGALVNNGDVFCQTCGNKVDGQQLPSTVTPKQKHCSHCGIEVSEGNLFCERCGAKIDSVLSASATEPPQNVCPHCGVSMNNDDVFCQNCGNKVGGQPTEKEEHKPNKNSFYAFWVVIGVLFLIVIGALLYTRYFEKREVKNVSNIEMNDSVEIASVEIQEKDYKQKTMPSIYDLTLAYSEMEEGKTNVLEKLGFTLINEQSRMEIYDETDEGEFEYKLVKKEYTLSYKLPNDDSKSSERLMKIIYVRATPIVGDGRMTVFCDSNSLNSLQTQYEENKNEHGMINDSYVSFNIHGCFEIVRECSYVSW